MNEVDTRQNEQRLDTLQIRAMSALSLVGDRAKEIESLDTI